MKLNDIWRDNKLFLSEKGTICLAKAILDSNPLFLLSLDDYWPITNQRISESFGELNLPEDEIVKVLNLFERYTKLWIFS
jgi:hypothetical protein